MTGQSANLEDAIDWFNKYGGVSATSLRDYSWDGVSNALRNGNLVYMGAKRKTGGAWFWSKYSGHAWVIDGLMVYNGVGEGEMKLVHCNFGYNGQADGYYIDDVFDIGKGGGAVNGWEWIDWNENNDYLTRPEYDKMINDDRNYKYNKKVSFIGKR